MSFSIQSTLKLPHIIEKIACNLPLQDLRNCRLVNKFWASEMERHLHLRITLPLDGCDLSEAEEVIAKKRAGLDISVHNILMANGLSFQNSIFRSAFNCFGNTLSSLIISGKPANWSSTLLYKILAEYAPNLEKFVFLSSRLHYEFIQLPFWFQRRMYSNSLSGSLRELAGKMTFPKIKVLEWDEGGPLDVTDLYILFPNLKTLKVVKAGSSINDESIFEIRHWRSLRYLELCTEEVEFQNMLVLQRMQLNLLQFVLRFSQFSDEGSILEESFSDFLATIANTCIRMDIRFVPVLENPRKFYMPFPLLPNLKRLKILSTANSPFKLENLNQMPKLKALAFSYGAYSDECMVNYPLESVQAVIEREDVLFKLCNITTLTRLTIHPYQIRDDDFRNIVTKCTYLQKLQVSFDSFEPQMFPCELLLTDSGITGIPQEDLNKLPEGQSENFPNISALRKHPWVGSLKYLTHFIVHGTNGQVTKKSVLYGAKHVDTLWYYCFFTETLDAEETIKENDKERECNCDYTCDRCTTILIEEFEEPPNLQQNDSSNGVGEQSVAREDPNETDLNKSMTAEGEETEASKPDEFFWPSPENNCHLDEEYFRFVNYVIDKYN